MDVAGQAGLAVLGLRRIGIGADLFAPVHPFAYEQGPDIVPPSGRIPYVMAVARAASAHDTFHYHYGAPLLRKCADTRLLGLLRRRIVVEFHGSDVRVPSIERGRNRHYVQIEGEDDDLATERMRRWARLTRGHAIYSDPSLRLFLAPYFAHLHRVPLRVDVGLFKPAPPDSSAARTTIVHAPSSREGKGTRYVRAAVEALAAAGVPVDYREIHGLSHEATRTVCSTADLVIDQLCSGAHGVFAVEAMAMAKPVVCYLLPEVVDALPEDLPIINASPETVYDVLADWSARPAHRHDLGVRSRSYAERVHDVAGVARRLRDVYLRLPAGRA